MDSEEEEEEEEEEEDQGETRSKEIVGHLGKEKKLKADKNLEELLDRTKSGGGGMGCRGEGFLHVLQSQQVGCISFVAEDIAAAPRADLQSLAADGEDWTQAGVAPGATATSVTACGSLERRSEIQKFPVPVRDQKLKQRLLELISAEAFWCMGAAPECASFSRAVNPAVRSREHPEGLENLTANMTLNG